MSDEELARINKKIREASERTYGPGGSGRMARTGEEDFDNNNTGFGGAAEDEWEFKTEKKEDAEQQDKPEEETGSGVAEDGIPLEVKVYAKDCSSESDYFLTGVMPSSISISGTVTDQYGDPVAGATVALIEKKKETKTDKNGSYTITASHGGDTPYSATVDFVVTRKLSGLKARLTPKTLIVANGKTTEATLEITHDKGPLKEMEVDISDTKGFVHGEEKIQYVQHRNSNSGRETTDENGRLTFTLNNPDSVRYLGPGVSSESSFPVTGFLRVRVPSADTDTVVSYVIENPFPRILNVTAARYLEAGLWQIEPSEVTIADCDSGKFIITLSGMGSFKEKGDRKSKYAGHPRLLHATVNGYKFFFHYRPVTRGFNITDQPQVGKIVGECAGKIYLSVLTNVGGDELLKSNRLEVETTLKQTSSKLPAKTAGLHLGNDIDFSMTTLTTVKSYVPVSEAATKTLAGASHVSNIGNVGMTTYVGADDIKGLAGGEFTEQNIITTADNAIGLADTVMGLADTLKTTSGKLYWEALKASWEMDKAAYTISKQYYDLAEAYQELVQEIVTITVEDDSGRKVDINRPYNVLIWRGGS